MHKRICVVFFSIIVVFGILISNLGLIFAGVGIYKTSQGKNTRSIELSQSRGMIYDTKMRKIVNNSTDSVTVLLPTTKAFNMITGYLTNKESDLLYKNMKNG